MARRWLFVLLCLVALQARALQVVDDRGVTVTLAQTPQRIVSLLPSLTEIVCELGACPRLVGVDNYSNWPVAVQKLPHVGGLADANVETIVSLRPDVVLLSLSSGALTRLEALGVTVIALEPKTLADVQRVLGQVGKIVDTPESPVVWGRISRRLDQAARSLPPALRGTTVYFEADAGPYAASESSFIGELLARVGAANVVPGSLGPFPKLNPEFVVRADPQVIMLSDRNAQALSDRPGWGRIRAVRDGRVCTFTQAQGDVLVRPGPRLAEAAQLMVACLRSQHKGGAP